MNLNRFFISNKIFLYISIISIISFQESSAQNDSLISYLEIAAKNNPLVQQKYYEYKAALQKIPQAGALQDPELNFGVFLQPMELVEGRQRAEASLMQMFPWFGVLRNAKDEMSLMANAKYEEFRDAKLQVFYEVQRTFYELFKLRNNIRISGRNEDILKSIESIALIRYKTGPVSNQSTVQQPAGTNKSTTGPPAGSSAGMQGMSGNAGAGSAVSSQQQAMNMQGASGMNASGTGTNLSDLYRIKIELSDLENNISLLHDQEQSAIARFNSLLNRSPLSHVFSADTIITDTMDLSSSAIIDSIKSGNPMLSMTDYEKQSYESRKKMVRAMGYPMVGVGLNYSVIDKNVMNESSTMNGKDMLMPMFRVTLPIYRKKYKAMKNEAELLIRSSDEKYAGTYNDLQSEYYNALQMYNDAQRKINLYNEQFNLASKSLDLMMSSFSTSGSGLTDVLRVRQQTLDYELKKSDATADLNTAVAWIKRLMASDVK
ncbi:MAG TPA: TolC family protein [Bacteroidales bacterium]|nr:TolC family protein [Bacteroidales bacterium]